MKTERPWQTDLLCQLIHFAAPLALGTGLAHAVPVAIPVQADLGISENATATDGSGALSDSSPFSAPNLNTRYTNTNRNEVIVLRFDLTGYNRADITAASLNLVNYSANNATIYRLWGVNDGATGYDATTLTEGTGTDNDWPEDGTKFATTPSLEFDANSKTRGNLAARSTDLGTAAASSLTEGSEIALSTTALKDFLVAHPDDIVTIVLTAETVNSGIKRFASKEATTLNTGGTPQPAGTYAPRLVIDLPGQRLTPVADMGFAEDTGGGSNSDNFNARWNQTRNDVIGLRFDLTGVDRSAITAAEVTLTNFRNNTTTTPLHFYGVIDGSTGYDAVNLVEGTTTDDNWVEGGTSFAEMPGLEYDADTTTSAVRLDRTVDLGAVSSGSKLTEGTKISMASEALVNFLKNHPDDIVTVVVVDADGTFDGAGQSRYASKEATTLTSGGAAEPAGTYAPELNFLLGSTTPPAADFRITEFTGAPGVGDITLTWLSQPGDTYSVSYSTALDDGFTSTVQSGINASAGTTTTHVFANPLPAAEKVFFRVSKP